MKLLKDILNNISILELSGSTSVEITNIQFDSRKVVKGSLFVAQKGVSSDGHQFIQKAIDLGASALLVQEIDEYPTGITTVKVADTHLALGWAAANFYNHPSKKLKMAGVTGTNGKTTTATLCYNLFRELGYNCGLLSTVVNLINDTEIPATHTTPDAVSLNQLLAQMVKEGCTHCFMEVSSHAIHQHRIAGLHFDVAAFTNITHDHLDYHKTFDEYIKAKKMFFDLLPKEAVALSNKDDKNGEVMLQNTKATKQYYSLKSMADYKGKVLTNSFEGLEMKINDQEAWFKLVGDFNAYNLLCIYGVALALGEDKEEVLRAMSVLETAKGRFQSTISATGIVSVVDYAHTPDALENVLKTIKSLATNGKIITVVGCGGNRDTTKRPVMAQIATKYSDQVVLTSDNPRNETPEDIINEMYAGVGISFQRKVLKITDRREAIKLAVTLANKGDIILVAGKGHEDYQEVMGVKTHFSDFEELSESFKMLNK
jgi:UDP-N-acetylmuramoyl-L-alanyl-D-glutamate--2,6-diaminopimelate ligase